MREWKTIRIPLYVYEKIRYLAGKLHTNIYRVVEDAVNSYEIYLRQPYRKKELPRLDKAAWYAYKLSQSIGAFKENPCEENLAKLMRTVEQVRERYGLGLPELMDVLQRIRAGRGRKLSTREIIDLNDAAKIAVADIIARILLEEEEEEGGG